MRHNTFGATCNLHPVVEIVILAVFFYLRRKRFSRTSCMLCHEVSRCWGSSKCWSSSTAVCSVLAKHSAAIQDVWKICPFLGSSVVYSRWCRNRRAAHFRPSVTDPNKATDVRLRVRSPTTLYLSVMVILSSGKCLPDKSHNRQTWIRTTGKSYVETLVSVSERRELYETKSGQATAPGKHDSVKKVDGWMDGWMGCMNNTAEWPNWSVPMAERSEARTVSGRSNTGIMGSNPTRGMDVCPRLSVLYRPVCR
jgi:hypothetical protein